MSTLSPDALLHPYTHVDPCAARSDSSRIPPFDAALIPNETRSAAPSALCIPCAATAPDANPRRRVFRSANPPLSRMSAYSLVPPPVTVPAASASTSASPPASHLPHERTVPSAMRSRYETGRGSSSQAAVRRRRGGAEFARVQGGVRATGMHRGRDERTRMRVCSFAGGVILLPARRRGARGARWECARSCGAGIDASHALGVRRGGRDTELRLRWRWSRRSLALAATCRGGRCASGRASR
ncbi:hypothetical protein DFH09DRAFT_1424697 [Mycena vulgaris]|nr:hypothetical protein DFH09DRAFT_1424697 [Mycena vulgaris]